jgi:hypothetical protein
MKGIHICLCSLVPLLLVSCGGPSLEEYRSVLKAQLMPDMAAFDFGAVEVGLSKDQAFVISNVGSSTADNMNGEFYLSVHFSFAGGTYPGEGGNCGTSLAAGETCTIVVRFAPRYSGDITGVVRMNFFNGAADTDIEQPTLKGKGIGDVEP